MALTRKSATLGANNNGASTWTVTTNEATATAAGDVVLVVHSNDYYALSNMGTPSATGSPTMNAISGATADGGASQPHIKMWWYVANTAGAQTVTFTETGTPDEERAGFLVVYGGADPTNPVDAVAATSGLQASSTSVVAPSVTTTYADDQVLAYAAVAGSTNPTFTSPGSLTELADWNVGGTFGGGTAGGAALTSAGATGTFTFTASVAATYVAATVTIKAARPVLAYSELKTSVSNDLTSLVSSAITVTNGDVIVVKIACEDQASPTPTTPTATGLTFTDYNTDSTGSYTGGHIYAAVVSGSPGTVTITSAWGGTGGWHSAVFERWTGAQLAGTPATNSTKLVTSSGGFSGSITTAAADSAVTWLAGDWSANAPGTPAYRSGAVQDGIHDKSTASYVAYYATQTTPAAAGAQTFGLTTPAGSGKWKYLALEIQYAAPAPPSPQIGLRAAGTSTASTAAVTAINPAVPAGTTTGDLSVLCVECKPYSTTITTPSGWTKIGEATNGTVASAADVGSTKIAMFVKESAAPGAIGNMTLTGADSACAVIHSYFKDSAYTWDYSQFTTGGDTTNGANYSATGSSGIAVATDDWVIAATAVNTDLAVGGPSAQAIGGLSGATLSQAVRTAGTSSGQGLVTTGNDTRLMVVDADVTAGSSSAAPTFTYTLSSSSSGTSMWLRIRQVSAGQSATVAMVGAGTMGVTPSLTKLATVAMVGDTAMSVTGSGTVSPTVGMVGAGTMAVTATTGPVAAVSMTGAGTMSVTAVVTRSAAVTMTGAGTMSITGLDVVSPAVAIAGVGAMAITAVVVISPSVAMVGAGTMAITPTLTQVATVAMVGTGTMAVTTTVTRVAAVAMVGAGTMTVTGVQTVQATVAMLGTGTMAVTATTGQIVAVPMTGAGTMTVTGVQTVLGTIAMTGTGVMAVTGAQTVQATMAMVGVGTMTVAVTHVVLPTVGMVGVGTLTVTGVQTIPATVAMVGAGVMAVAIQGSATAAVAMVGVGTMAVVGFRSTTSTIAITGAGTMSVTVTHLVLPTVTMTGAGVMTIAVTRTVPSAVAMTGAGIMTITPVTGSAGAVAMIGVGTLTVAAVVARVATVTMVGAGTMTVTVAITARATVAMVGAGALTITGVSTIRATLAMVGAGVLTVIELVVHSPVLLMTGSGTMSVTLAVVRAAVVRMVGVGVLTIGGSLTRAVSVPMVGIGALTVVPTIISPINPKDVPLVIRLGRATGLPVLYRRAGQDELVRISRGPQWTPSARKWGDT